MSSKKMIEIRVFNQQVVYIMLTYFQTQLNIFDMTKNLQLTNGSSKQCLAIVLMSVTQILFPMSYIYGSEHNLSMAELNIFRGIVLMVICLVLAKMKKINLEKSIKANFTDFMIRNSIVVVHTYSIFFCHYYLSVSAIHTINSFGTLFVFMWDYYLYNITINRKQFIGILMGVAGMLITVNSTQLYLLLDHDFETGSTFKNYRSNNLVVLFGFAIFLVFANIIWAYSASMIKTVKMKDSCEMNFHLSIFLLFSAGINYCLIDIQGKNLEAYIGIILFNSLPLGIGQVIFVMSLTLTKNTGIITLFLSLSIIVGYCFSLVRYHQNINPIAIVGSLLIISGLTFVVMYKEDRSISIKRDED